MSVLLVLEGAPSAVRIADAQTFAACAVHAAVLHPHFRDLPIKSEKKNISIRIVRLDVAGSFKNPVPSSLVP